MLQTLKINRPANQVAFISDLHYTHDKPFLWGKRGYASSAEHDAGVVARWNEVCTDDSVCFHLGDLVFKDPDGSKFRDLIRQLKFGTLYLLLGNHNSGLKKIYAKVLEDEYGKGMIGREVYPLVWYPTAMEDRRVVFLPEYVEAFVNGQHIVMCHFPVISHNRIGHGSWMLCGHSHQTLPLTNRDTGRGKRLDLGVEGWGRPITFAEVRDHLKDRPTDSWDHHDVTTS